MATEIESPIKQVQGWRNVTSGWSITPLNGISCYFDANFKILFVCTILYAFSNTRIRRKGTPTPTPQKVPSDP